MLDFPYKNDRIKFKKKTLRSIQVNYGWSDSPFGKTLILLHKSDIVGIAFDSDHNKENIEENMKARWVGQDITFQLTNIKKYAQIIFNTSSQLDLIVHGTAFQLNVWEALLTIPTGATSTYSSIAKSLGKPKATRAVGTAIGKNPIAWLIPCHRILRKTGALGGYHWGLSVKNKMLLQEQEI